MDSTVARYQRLECMTYSGTEAARVLGVDRKIIGRMVRDGKLPSIDVGGRRIVIPKWAVDRLVQPPTSVTIEISPAAEVQAAVTEAQSS